jgi:hypothetical protein
MGEAKRRKAVAGAGPARWRRLAPRGRLAPITKLVVPAGPGMPSPEVAARALALAERSRQRLRDILIAASAADDMEVLLAAIETIGAGEVAGFEQDMATELAARSDRRGEMAGIACRRGCAFCCHVDVVVTVFEAVRIAAALKSGLLPARAAAAASLPPAAPPSPCPLLIDGACSAYGMRPFACRALFSPDAALCEQGFAAPGGTAVLVPSLTWPRFLSIGYVTGQLAAMNDLGLAGHLTVLRSALAVLREDEAALGRWLAGADIFPRPAG